MKGVHKDMANKSTIIAVTSGKGGTGKSSISACLGYASSPLRERPSNAEFIAMATDKIHLQIITAESRENKRPAESKLPQHDSNSFSFNM